MRGEPFSILPFAECHLSEVAEIERLCFSEPWSEQSLRLLLGDGGFGVVAMSEGRVLGYGGMTYVLDEGSVTNIAVHPHARRQGVGRAVTQELLRLSRTRGVVCVFLEVRESNLPAISLYRSEGFEECGVRKNFYRRPVESALLMVYRATEGEENT